MDGLTEQQERRIDAVVEQDVCLQEAIQAEPQVLHLLRIAVIPQDESRWRRYELLKNLGMSLVGWEARAEHLRTTRHYQSFIEAIDSLLPTEDEEQQSA